MRIYSKSEHKHSLEWSFNKFVFYYLQRFKCHTKWPNCCMLLSQQSPESQRLTQSSFHRSLVVKFTIKICANEYHHFVAALPALKIISKTHNSPLCEPRPVLTGHQYPPQGNNNNRWTREDRDAHTLPWIFTSVIPARKVWRAIANTKKKRIPKKSTTAANHENRCRWKVEHAKSLTVDEIDL